MGGQITRYFGYHSSHAPPTARRETTLRLEFSASLCPKRMAISIQAPKNSADISKRIARVLGYTFQVLLSSGRDRVLLGPLPAVQIGHVCEHASMASA